MVTTRLTYPLVAIALALAIFASLAVGQGPADAQGIGIYPTNLSFQDAARGGVYFRTVGVINSGASDTLFTLDGEGPIGEWVSFVDVHDRANVIQDVRVAGNSEKQTLLRVSVPEDAANGEYQGSARIVAQGEAAQPSGASVGVGAAIDVKVTVTGEQRLGGSLVDSSVSDVEVGSPLRIRAMVRNSGNVRFTPQVTLEVLDQDNNVVTQETFLPEVPVFPDETGQLENELDVSDRGLAEGQYVARISAKAGNLELGTRETSFSILPPGTLTRQGELRNIVLEVAPRPGGPGKLGIVFVNTGQIDTMAKFVGEMYFQDQLVDVLESDELLVPVREQKSLELFFRVDNPGEYLIKGKVNYQGKETDRKELAFTVTEEGTTEQGPGPGALEASETDTVSGPESPDSEASGGGGMPASGQPAASPSFWQKLDSRFQESPFNSPLGIVVMALGALVVLLLLMLLLRRRPRRYRYY